MKRREAKRIAALASRRHYRELRRTAPSYRPDPRDVADHERYMATHAVPFWARVFSEAGWRAPRDTS